MKRTASRLVVAAALIGIGWTVGRAQGSVPDFELRIDAPEGRTNVECVRGCQLAWVERMVPGTVTPDKTTFTYACGNSSGARCQSGRIGGWIAR
jgi:hypothetical protein